MKNRDVYNLLVIAEIELSKSAPHSEAHTQVYDKLNELELKLKSNKHEKHS